MMHLAKAALLRVVIVLFCLTQASGACASTASVTLVISGSSTIYPLIADVVHRFESLSPGIAITVRSNGSGKGIAELRSGLSDIAMVSRPLNDQERDLFAFALCRDGAAVVVHRSNPVKGLTTRQLGDLLTGRAGDWKQLGVRPGSVKLAWRAAGQAIPELLLQHLRLKPEEVRSHATIFENADAVRFVANHPNAVTIAALAVAERSVKSGLPVRLVPYEGVQASTRSVRDRSYMLSRPLLLAVREVRSGPQKRFIDYATSDAVADLHEKHGFVSYD